MIYEERNKFLKLSETDLRIVERYLFLMNRFYSISRIAKDLNNMNIANSCFNRFRFYKIALIEVIDDVMHNYNITNYDFSSLLVDDSLGGIHYNEK